VRAGAARRDCRRGADAARGRGVPFVSSPGTPTPAEAGPQLEPTPAEAWPQPAGRPASAEPGHGAGAARGRRASRSAPTRPWPSPSSGS
jgi:hypothetical protein